MNALMDASPSAAAIPVVPPAQERLVLCQRCRDKGVIVVKRRGHGTFEDTVYEEVKTCPDCKSKTMV